MDRRPQIVAGLGLAAAHAHCVQRSQRGARSSIYAIRSVGPAAFPFTLRAVRSVAGLSLGLPLIAAGGICRPEDAERCFGAGAVAVQIRSLLWIDPAAAVRLAEGLEEVGRPGTLPDG